MTKQKKQKSRLSVSCALLESMVAYETNNNEVSGFISHDMNAISQVEMTAKSVAAISRSHGDLYTLKTDKFTRRCYVKASPTGQDLHQCLRSSTSEIFKYFHAHTLNPYVDLYIRAVNQHEFDEMETDPLKSYFDDSAQRWVQRMNAFVQTLRLQTRSTKFKKLVQASQRSCNKNRKQFIMYVKALLRKNHRIRGLRVEFSYSTNHNVDQSEAKVSYAQAKCHREALIVEIRKRFKGVLLGYVWKFKYGLLQGYHSHVLIFLDGSQVPEDVTIAKTLGEHWCSVLTRGKGEYLNCKSDLPGYRLCGIGELCHDDPHTLQRLENIATYLTKLDHFVRLNTPGKDRTFGKGGLPKMDAKKNVHTSLRNLRPILEFRLESLHLRKMGSLLT